MLLSEESDLGESSSLLHQLERHHHHVYAPQGPRIGRQRSTESSLGLRASLEQSRSQTQAQGVVRCRRAVGCYHHLSMFSQGHRWKDERTVIDQRNLPLEPCCVFWI